MIPNDVILLLGGNRGDRYGALRKAEEEIEKTVGQVIRRSKVYETASWGDENLAPFLNQVIDVKTGLLPHELLQQVLQIEESMGRRRTRKWESRIIDIDILFYGEDVIQSPDLTIPHPSLHIRKFALIPLVETHSSKIHPVFQKTCKQLLEEVTDQLPVTEYKQPLAIN